MQTRLQQPDYRHDGKLQFVVGYTGGGAEMCVHLTVEELEARARAQLGEGKLVEVEGAFYWEH